VTLSKQQVREYRELQNSGVQVSKHNQVRYNEGSETSIHAAAKSLVGLQGIQHGYRVDSEVKVVDDYGNESFMDMLLWGHDSRTTLCVELEHSPTEEIKSRKLDQYVRNTAVTDMILINLNDCPAEIVECFGWLGAEIGLQP